jgi:hypothetical protein
VFQRVLHDAELTGAESSLGTLKWDAEAMQAVKVPETQRWIEGTYRKGWEMPA